MTLEVDRLARLAELWRVIDSGDPFLGVPAFVFVDSLNPNQGPGTIRIRSTLGACP